MGIMNRSKIIANFFLDGAKIIFGSLVVGAFLPSAIDDQSRFFAASIGIIFTIIFLAIADAVVKREK